MNHLTEDQFFRLEALRLAVQAGQPEERQRFYQFLTESDAPTASIAEQVREELAKHHSSGSFNSEA